MRFMAMVSSVTCTCFILPNENSVLRDNMPHRDDDDGGKNPRLSLSCHSATATTAGLGRILQYLLMPQPALHDALCDLTLCM